MARWTAKVSDGAAMPLSDVFFDVCCKVVSMRMWVSKAAKPGSPGDAQPVTPADVDPLETRLDEVRRKKKHFFLLLIISFFRFAVVGQVVVHHNRAGAL